MEPKDRAQEKDATDFYGLSVKTKKKRITFCIDYIILETFA